MPRRNQSVLPAPSGMASYPDPASLPVEKCQELVGWMPGRAGTLRQVPQLRPVKLPATYPAANGVAVFVYYSSTGLNDKLVLITADAHIWTAYLTNPSASAFSRVSYGGRQHARLTLPNFADQGPLVQDLTHYLSVCSGAEAVQYQDELIIMDLATGSLTRYYVDAANAQTVAPVGGQAAYFDPTTPLVQAAGGSLSIGTYKYGLAALDERGREGPLQTLYGSPAINTASINVSSASSKVTVYLSGWNWATKVRLYRTAANGATLQAVADFAPASTYVDTLADVNLGAAAPPVGENNAPQPATMGMLYKERLVLNVYAPYASTSLYPNPLAAQQIQISNAGSPTQFSAIALPTDPAAGLLLNVGTDSGDQVTALATLGSLGFIGLRRAIHLLQGQDSTNFEALPVHQRGVGSHASVRRAENVVPFLGSDGVYELGYQSGFSLMKISLDIEDFFHEQADLVGNGNESDFRDRLEAASLAGYVSSFYWQNCYYLSLPMETLVYDYVTKGWSKTGWGLLSSCALYTGAGTPDCVFALVKSNATGTASTLCWINNQQQMDDLDALVSVSCRLVTRPFDTGNAFGRRKRLLRVTQQGSAPEPGKVLGSFTLHTDNGWVETYPVRAGQFITDTAALFQQGFSPGALGRILYGVFLTDVPGLVLGQQIAEFADLSTEG